MIRVLSSLHQAASRFRKDESGNQTIEFIIFFPTVMFLFLAAVEVGVYSIRHVVLERGLDLTVRSIRLNQAAITAEDIRADVCANSLMIPDCPNQVRVEMLALDARNFTDSSVPAETKCLDISDGTPVQPANEVQEGAPNQLMVLRVCALFNPFFPTTGFGKSIPKASGGSYALVSLGAFAIEPF
ncbi:TadE/TadG family type IV pilus assembly protein [Aestuariibius insulae]|uniref:TadE/TadG family type IV pilus assembly protein n=1 Tax=Aestuariibius insulae TaxID=2058287 RepID=UPI00345ED0A9